MRLNRACVLPWLLLSVATRAAAAAPPTPGQLYRRLSAQVRATAAISGSLEVIEGSRRTRVAFRLLRPHYVQVIPVQGVEWAQYNDGKRVRFYSAKRHEFRTLSAGDSNGDNLLAPSATPFLIGLEAFVTPKHPPIVYNEPETTVFHGVRCHAIPLGYNGVQSITATLYLDAQTGLPVGWRRKNGIRLLTGIYHDLRLNAPLKPAQFAWTPPPAATEAHDAPNEEALLVKPGDAAPGITVDSLEGGKIALETIAPRHKATLLYFWLYGYDNQVPDAEDFPRLEALYREFGPQGLEIVAINVAEPAEMVRRVQQVSKVSFLMGIDGGEALAHFHAHSIPIGFLIDPQGRVAARFDTSGVAEAEIRRALTAMGFTPAAK